MTTHNQLEVSGVHRTRLSVPRFGVLVVIQLPTHSTHRHMHLPQIDHEYIHQVPLHELQGLQYRMHNHSLRI